MLQTIPNFEILTFNNSSQPTYFDASKKKVQPISQDLCTRSRKISFLSKSSVSRLPDRYTGAVRGGGHSGHLIPKGTQRPITGGQHIFCSPKPEPGFGPAGAPS